MTGSLWRTPSVVCRGARRGNGLILLLVVLALAVLGEAQDIAPCDTQEQPLCSGKGECKADGWCGCDLGYRGVSCSLGPVELRDGWSIPGRVDEDRPLLYFAIPYGDYAPGDEVEVIATAGPGGSTAEAVTLFASIGIVPSSDNAQFVAELPVTEQRKVEISTLSRASNAGGGNDETLYVVVGQIGVNPAYFTLKFLGSGGLIAGLPAAQFIAIIIGSSVCCLYLCYSYCACGWYYCARHRKKGAKNPYLQQMFGGTGGGDSTNYAMQDMGGGGAYPNQMMGTGYGGSVQQGYGTEATQLGVQAGWDQAAMQQQQQQQQQQQAWDQSQQQQAWAGSMQQQQQQQQAWGGSMQAGQQNWGGSMQAGYNNAAQGYANQQGGGQPVW